MSLRTADARELKMPYPKFHKGQHVRYRLDRVGKGCKVEAIVRHAHRDGTATVEARFFLNRQGEREGGYLGYRYRYDASLLEAA